MKTSRAMLFCLALGCLLLASTVPLQAQQPRPSQGQRVPPPSPVPKQAMASTAQSLEQRCREFLAPADELRSRFALTSDNALAADNELASTVQRARQCVELANARLRRAAFVAYELVRDEQDARASRDSEAVFTSMFDAKQEDHEKHEAELKKQRADFAEVANFAVTLFKQREQYHEEEFKVLRAYVELGDRYQELYKVADDAIHLAEKALYRSPGLSLPVFVNAPPPQVIRVETPAVPRSLHCSANTMPSPAAGLPTWTWTDCHW
jgi:hypothetical protein